MSAFPLNTVCIQFDYNLAGIPDNAYSLPKIIQRDLKINMQQQPTSSLQLHSYCLYLKPRWSCNLFRVAFSPMWIK